MIPLPKPVPGRKAPRAKLASTLVLLRGRGKDRQILMGKRSKKHDFMPSVYVFPGGRVDPADTIAKPIDQIHPRTQNILEHALSPARARACVMACIRETFEETSMILGEPTDSRPAAPNCPSWQSIFNQGFQPQIGNIHVFGRAITPPFRDKRFDTWFFVTELDACHTHQTAKPSAELVDIGWYTLQDAKALKIHRATAMMLEQLEIYLDYDNPPDDIFFSRVKGGKFEFGRFPSR